MKLRKISITVALGAIGLTLFAGAAFAGDSNLIVLPGNFSVSTPTVGNFASVTLNGSAQNTQASIDDLTVTDARGNGHGWTVTVQGTQFCHLTGVAPLTVCAPGANTLPLGSLKLSQIAVSKVDQTSSAPPSAVSAPAGGYTIDSGSVTLATAAGGQGMGSYSVSPGANGLKATVPASAYADTYTSTITFTAAATP